MKATARTTHAPEVRESAPVVATPGVAAGVEPELATESVSVIVPVMATTDDLAGLYEEYAPPMRELGCPFDFIFVVDAQYRAAAASLAPLILKGEPVTVVEAAQPAGEAALLRLGRSHSNASILVTLPAYRRIVAKALPLLVRDVAAGADLAVARRWPRVDSWVNRAQSRALHGIVGAVLGGGINDVRCGVRAMRPRVVEETVIYGDLVLFLPIVAMRQGFRVVEVTTPQHPRDVGARFYAPSAYFRRLLDVLALFVLLRFSEKPLRFFGTIGFVSAFIGSVLLAVIFFQRLGGQPIANRPILLLAGLLVVIGIEAIALGLIGEIIVYLNARYLGRSPGYRLREGDE